ncbi:DNA polymerase III subunit chi [Neisseria animalis]|uniref:DNA polymerase III subunit chi n=1 Tax=Neisseria animalis TaxID=492 RepID=A0A5P3MPB5_NEIAN|nr:DNA polymerase III subunit chi [Neisseria animalis]QEY23373.1 DNA polymerase III subunit chi [Neisseria animalis]ROW33218.1 DNA polymerase III subunit chi [Neisseria animalis]VEE08785.1 DNA polymerase III subunit chi [Neisseria animalis]
MPKATFYTHVAQPEVFANRLAARAVKESRVLLWVGQTDVLERLDRDLWQPPESFMPHEIWQPQHPIPPETPLLLASAPQLPPLPADFTVLNLSPDFWHTAPTVPARVLEIVGTSLEELDEARARFKAYRQNGFAIEHFNMQDKA